MNVRLIGITGGSGFGKNTGVRKIYEAAYGDGLIGPGNYYKKSS